MNGPHRMQQQHNAPFKEASIAHNSLDFIFSFFFTQVHHPQGEEHRWEVTARVNGQGARICEDRLARLCQDRKGVSHFLGGRGARFADRIPHSTQR